ncbi:endonuclease/exonuclease/phosphatase family protein [Nibricoccus aquaticus]|uniref:endonuclease/exonuclease/phosphatase family protein n=1 Tax=Nibricoccus aquaticus TaxID=2576891 RepID=UPI001586D3FA|nr:endonuclease/exonuclease/phosphatase family protein [Nibricoccus aquaticus]
MIALWFALVGVAWAETLTVATYNLENYVAANRVVEGVYREGYPKPEAAKAALRAVIKALDADVIALQEIGPRPYLEELRRDLKSEGVDYPYVEWIEAADTERHVAVLSRRAFTAVTKHVDLTFAYFGKEERVKRGLLEVRVASAGGEVALFVVHLKSRYTDRADDVESAKRRAGEAEAVRERVLRVFPEPEAVQARYLIVGDFNDGPGARPLRALSARGKTTIAEVLAAMDSRGETWTHFYRKEDSYSRVDYVLVSPRLKPAVVGGVAAIFDEAGVREASDHRPVVVRLDFGRWSSDVQPAR